MGKLISTTSLVYTLSLIRLHSRVASEKIEFKHISEDIKIKLVQRNKAKYPAKIMASREDVEAKLNASFSPIHLNLEDLSDGCGAKWHAIVVSDKFNGVPLKDRHQMVYAALEEEMKSIHALTMKTWTKEQWEKNKNK